VNLPGTGRRCFREPNNVVLHRQKEDARRIHI
jgi:hypothetical protein